MKNKNLTIKDCLSKLERIKLPLSEEGQLRGLVFEFGYLGAIEYLKPLDWDNPGRDQVLANRHLEILKNIN